jgi:hypothetical protein
MVFIPDHVLVLSWKDVRAGRELGGNIAILQDCPFSMGKTEAQRRAAVFPEAYKVLGMLVTPVGSKL